MKKILLVLAVTGVLISCSSQDETVKKETVKTTVATPQVETTQQTVVPEQVVTSTTEGTENVAKVEEESAVANSDTTSEAVKPTTKRHIRTSNKKATSPTTAEPNVEEKASTEPTTPLTTETSVDKAVDSDVDKKIAEIEIDSKKVEPQPVEEKKSNKTLYGAIIAIVVAAGAVVAFKKK